MSDAPNSGVRRDGAVLLATYAPSIVEQAVAFGAGAPFGAAGERRIMRQQMATQERKYTRKKEKVEQDI